MAENKVKTALIGTGAWGINVARELRAANALAAFSNASGETPPELAGIPYASLEDIALNADIEAVWVATPIATHAHITKQMLEAGKHVMCEKPLATSSAKALMLASHATEKSLLLATGYIFIYHPVYAEFKKIIGNSGATSVECIWNKYGTFDETIEMNLLTHHLAVAYDLFGIPITASHTRRESGETICDALDTSLVYDNCRFFSRINRFSQEKNHSFRAVLSDGSILLWNDDTLMLDDRVVFNSPDQPLKREVDTFLGKSKELPTVGTFGANVLRVHEMIRT